MAKVMGAALVGLVGLVAASAAVAAAPAVPGNNCTGTQEEQVALSTPGHGIRFAYDLQGNSIRKFKVYLDSPTNMVLDAIQIEPQPKEDARVQAPSGTAVRTLWDERRSRRACGLRRDAAAVPIPAARAASGNLPCYIYVAQSTNVGDP